MRASRMMVRFLVSLLLLVITMAGCNFFLWDSQTDCTESAGWMALPPSATIVSESCSSFLNLTYEVVFTMSPDDLGRLQGDTRIREWETDVAAVTQYEEQAARMESLLFGDYGDGAYQTYVLVDTSNRDEYTVYLYNSFVD